MPRFYQPYQSSLVQQLGQFNPPPPEQIDRDIIPRSLNEVFEAYARIKGLQGQEQKLALQQQQDLSQRGLQLAETGFDPARFTEPGFFAQAQGPETAVESPVMTAARDYLSQKKKSRELKNRAGEAEVGKTLAEKSKLEAEAGAIPGARGLKAETELRGELQKLSKPFFEVRDAMGRIEASAKNPSAAGDLALIFNYMKVLDPGSTVREGEFATAQNSAGVPDRISNIYNRVIKGERLAEKQRDDFVSRARDLYKSQAAIQRRQEAQYKGLSERIGARPENVILQQELPETPESIREAFQTGNITREQARERITALRGGTNAR